MEDRGKEEEEKNPSSSSWGAEGVGFADGCPFPQTPHILDFEILSKESSSLSSKEPEACKSSSTGLINAHVFQREKRSRVLFACSFFNPARTFSQTFKPKVPIDRNQQQYLSTACNNSNNHPSLIEAPPTFKSCLNRQIYEPLWRTVWRFLKKLEMELPYDPAIPLLDIRTEETRSERDMCTPIFITALFTIARTWKQPRYPSADEWIRKLWYIYTTGYYSSIKKNPFESGLMRWMKLEPIIQSEVSQKEKHQYRYPS